MLNVIQVVPAIANEASGPSYSVVRLCESVIEQGENVSLTALDWAPFALLPSFLKTFPLGVGPRRLGRSPAMRRWLEEQARSGEANILHNHSLWMLPNLYSALAVKGTDCKLVVSPRGTLSDWALNNSRWRKRLLWPWLVRPVMQEASMFHATAESEYEDIRRLGYRQPVAVIPNGIDIPEAKVAEKESDKRLLLFLGRIHKVKGVPNLLRAWSYVESKFTDWELVVAGPDNGGHLEEMQGLAQELGLERCRFVGALYGAEKARAYARAELYVLPTYSENFGMTVAEALASGTPAIVTKGAPWQGLESEGAGWWIDIGVEPLEACLRQALACSREELQQKGLRGRQWMIREYSWAHIGRQMMESYHWLLNGGERPEWIIVD